MLQQINLYRLLPHQIKSFIDLKLLYRMYLGLVAVLMVVYLLGFSYERYLTHRYTVANAQLTESQHNLQKEAAEFPQLDSTQMAMNVSKIASCKVKFSPLLADFAEAVVPGLWLTDISISQNAHQITLKGYTTRGIAVQEFLELLNKRPLFANLPFVMQDLAMPLATTTTKGEPVVPANVLGFTLQAGGPA